MGAVRAVHIALRTFASLCRGNDRVRAVIEGDLLAVARKCGFGPLPWASAVMSGQLATYRRIRLAIEQAQEVGAVTILHGSTELPSSAALAYANTHIPITRIEGVTVLLDGVTVSIGPTQRGAAA